MSDQTLLAMPAREFFNTVNAAYRHSGNLNLLSSSPLAGSSLTAAAVLPGNGPENQDDLGRGLRMLLCWATEQLAPAPAVYPLGTRRPLEDPTLNKPAWRLYNALRHLSLDPFPQRGGEQTDAAVAELVRLVGLPKRAMFYTAYRQAIGQVAAMFRRMMIDGRNLAQITDWAAAEFIRPLSQRRGAMKLLQIAAIFPGPIPRGALMSIAEAERMSEPEQEMDYLLGHRMIGSAGDGRELQVPPRLRTYVAGLTPPDVARRWHATVLAQSSGSLLSADRAWHQYWSLPPGRFLAAIIQQLPRIDQSQRARIAAVLDGIVPGELTVNERQLFKALRRLFAVLLRYPGLPAPCVCGAAECGSEPPEAFYLLPSAIEAAGVDYRQAENLFALAEQRLPRNRAAWLLAKAFQSDMFSDVLDGEQALAAAESVVAAGPDAGVGETGLGHYARARALLLLGQPQEALAAVHDAHIHLEVDGLLPFAIRCHAVMSEAHLRLLQVERADHHARLAVERSRKQGFALGLSAGLRAQAAVRAKLNLPAEELGLLQQALATGESQPLPRDLFATHCDIAQCLVRLGRLPEARGHWMQAADLSARMRAPALIALLASARAELGAGEAMSEEDKRARAALAAARLGQDGTVFTAADVAKILACSEPTARRLLLELEKDGALERRQRSRGIAFALAGASGSAPRPAGPDTASLSPIQQQVFSLLQRTGRLTLHDVISSLGTSRASGQRSLARLAELGLARQEGKGRSSAYVLIGNGQADG